MESLPYYYGGEGGWKRHFEGLIPIIILILIGIVLVGKTTSTFCGVPVLGSLFCSKSITHIAVIGDFSGVNGDYKTSLTAPTLKDVLDGPLAKTYNMYYTVLEPNMLVYANDALIKNYDIVVLVGDQAFTRPVKDAVGDYVNGGGKLIVIGDAAVRDPEDPNYIGWGGGMFDTFPVRLNTYQELTPFEFESAPLVKIMDINHAIVKGYGMTLNLSKVNEQCDQGLKLLDVWPTGGGTIAILSGTVNGKTKDVPAIVEGGSMFGGKVFYFAYDPGCTPNLWISTVKYLTGK